jgi:hypothetical protein
VSNRRKLKAASRPLPRCPDCDSVTYTGTMPDGAALIQVDHDPWCPSWRGITPSATERYALAEALDGRTVVYLRDRRPAP